MSDAIRKEDLRIIKTDDAINKSLTILLEKRLFSQVTIMDICKEARISRATFYAHYNDKYDLLKNWLEDIDIFNWNEDYQRLENAINEIVYNNKKIVKNIITDACEETQLIFCNWIVDDLIDCDRQSNSIITINFATGGILRYIHWQVKNHFPISVPFMNRNIYELINVLIK